MVHLTRRLWAHPTILWILVLLAFKANAAELETIRDHFRTNQKQLQTMFVHWRRTVQVSPGEKGTYLNSECRAAIKGDKRFFDIRFERASGPAPPKDYLHRALSFDGGETRILMLSQHARIWPGDKRDQFDAPDDFLALQGYPKSEFRVRIGKSSVSCDITALLQRQDYSVAGRQMVDATECIVVAGPSDRLFFDPARGFALLRRQVVDPENATVQTNYVFQKLEEVQPTCWLARTISEESVTDQGRGSSSQLTAVELDFVRVPDELFSLLFDPGISVEDVRHFAANADGTIPIVAYKIPAKPKDLDKVIALAVERRQVADVDATSVRTIRWVVVIVNLVTIAALVAFVARRRLKRFA